MPYSISKQDGKYYVMKRGKRMNKKGYDSKARAIKYLRALYSHLPKSERVT